jgi:hypothetical protein
VTLRSKDYITTAQSLVMTMVLLIILHCCWITYLRRGQVAETDQDEEIDLTADELEKQLGRWVPFSVMPNQRVFWDLQIGLEGRDYVAQLEKRRPDIYFARQRWSSASVGPFTARVTKATRMRFRYCEGCGNKTPYFQKCPYRYSWETRSTSKPQGLLSPEEDKQTEGNKRRRSTLRKEKES